MHAIPFTQFLMPDGRRQQTSIDVGDAEFAAYEKVKAAGFRMTVEMLSDYSTVSQCIEDPELGDFDIELCPNGPEVPRRLSAMLLRFDPVLAAKWREEMS